MLFMPQYQMNCCWWSPCSDWAIVCWYTIIFCWIDFKRTSLLLYRPLRTCQYRPQWESTSIENTNNKMASDWKAHYVHIQWDVISIMKPFEDLRKECFWLSLKKVLWKSLELENVNGTSGHNHSGDDKTPKFLGLGDKQKIKLCTKWVEYNLWLVFLVYRSRAINIVFDDFIPRDMRHHLYNKFMYNRAAIRRGYNKASYILHTQKTTTDQWVQSLI